MGVVNNIIQYAWSELIQTVKNIGPIKGTLVLGGLSVLSYLAYQYMNRSSFQRPISTKLLRDDFKSPMIYDFKHLEVGELEYFPDDEEELACLPLKMQGKSDMDIYLSPTEGTPINVKPHLDLMENGWIVSTGTERSLYDLLLSNPKKCKGVIIRDINENVKFYTDFLVLLLRTATTREEFVAWTKMSLEGLKPILIPKIGESGMSDKMKAYYITNFNALGACYLGEESHLPNYGDSSSVNYFENDALFNKLQKYAKAGKIIATVGEINNLEFAGKRKITLVDTSNIHAFSPICLNWNGDHPVRLIYTSLTMKGVYYCSCSYDKPKPNLIERMQKVRSEFSDYELFEITDCDNGPNIFERRMSRILTESTYEILTKALADRKAAPQT